MTHNFRSYLDGKKLWQLEDILRGLKIFKMGQEMLSAEGYQLDDVPVGLHIEGLKNEIVDRKEAKGAKAPTKKQTQ